MNCILERDLKLSLKVIKVELTCMHVAESVQRVHTNNVFYTIKLTRATPLETSVDFTGQDN